MNEKAIESFIARCDDLMIANEGLLSNTKMGIKNKIKKENKKYQRKYSVATSGDQEDLSEVINGLDSKIEAIQNKLEGENVKNKDILQSMLTMYEGWKEKFTKVQQGGE